MRPRLCKPPRLGYTGRENRTRAVYGPKKGGFAVCSRFFLPDEVPYDELAEIIAEVNRKIAGLPGAAMLKTRGEVRLTDVAPVLLADGPSAMRWGFMQPGISEPIFNARSEGLLEKPMFRAPALSARCLIPAAYYFEWERRGKERVKYRLRPRGDGPVYMAAIWREERGAALPAFSIVTREAVPDIRFIHGRMPVMLGKAAREAWLAPGAGVETVLDAAERDIQWQPDAPEQTRLFW